MNSRITVENGIVAKSGHQPLTEKCSSQQPLKLADLQTCGFYVLFLTFTYGSMVFSQTCNLLFMTFADRKPHFDFHCDQTLEAFGKECNKTDCWINHNGSQILCDKEESYDFGSIRSEFVGATPTQIKFGTFGQNIGLLAGAFIFGNLADAFGRKKVLIGGSLGLAIMELVTSFAPNLVLFNICRFFVMIFNGGKHCVCNPFFMENLPDRHRMWVATVVTYSPTYILLSLAAYICGDWRTLARFSCALTIVPLILLFFVYDTPRFLILKGKDKEAEEAALAIKKWDTKITEELKEKVHQAIKAESDRQRAREAAMKHRYTMFDIFKSWTLTKYDIVFSISLFSASFVSYGVAYNMDALAGNVYVNVIILGGARYAINIIAALIELNVKCAGRRVLHMTSIAVIVLLMGTLMVTESLIHPDLVELKKARMEGRPVNETIEMISAITRYLALLAAAMCTEVFVLDAVQPSELFPTPVRSGGNALIQVFNRLGTICSPLAFIPAAAWPAAPYLLMTLTSLADLILYSMWIPETRGKPLPDKMPADMHEDEPDGNPLLISATTTPDDDEPQIRSRHQTGVH
ncbi:Solute carrier family 22 member 6-A [Toxocara canis]|uniref:Solute carrier family 22 member 6-A n=1 Tax=Toxocara canis TaxID=6265 RepID=A0A0B2W5G1_TOXCA|nr:Solute carrier family 22 member 6-A [Toxocara canis]